MDMLPTLFCPGCGNGIVLNAAIAAIEKLGVRKDTACVSGIGCSSWIPCYLDMDVIHSMHGRALPVAQGLKLAAPDKNVMVFTGDGDCLAIGGNHMLHAAARNIDLTVIMVNNNIYGMTGGQKSPTTPEKSVTKTSPYGVADVPIDGCGLAISMGATYVARWTSAHPRQLEKSIVDGMSHKGFSFIEVLAQCPIQAGRGVFGTRDATDILGIYQERARSGDIETGVLKHTEGVMEYGEKIGSSLEGCKNE
jgi:2-oxoglutarate ferredoxin oxidoreductase subunit beta